MQPNYKSGRDRRGILEPPPPPPPGMKFNERINEPFTERLTAKDGVPVLADDPPAKR